MAGIDTTGFETKRLPDIQTSLNDKFIAALGSGINLEDDSLLGQIRDIVSLELTQLWEANQATYDSSTPSKAEGVQLDDVVARVGISRLDAAKSSVTALMSGTSGTLIPAGSRVAVNTTGELFEATRSTTIDLTNCFNTNIDITSVLPTTAYVVTINNVQHSYTSLGSTSANAIATGLAGVILAATPLVPVSAVVGTDNRLLLTAGKEIQTATAAQTIFTLLRVTNTPLIIKVYDLGGIEQAVPAYTLSSTNIVTFATGITLNYKVEFLNTGTAYSSMNVALAVQMSANYVTGLVPVSAVNFGKVLAPVGQLTVLSSSISGVTSVTNNKAASVGRLVETDTELRIRRAKSLAVAGTATLEAIVSKVGQVSGVTAAAGTENVSNAVDVNLLPPHSFEIIVSGGVDTEVAQAIWDTKPAGIATYGGSTANAIDSSGASVAVNFSIPAIVPITVVVSGTRLPEEILPDNYQAAIKQIIVDVGSTLNIGNDVIAQRFFGEIYRQVPGILSLTITVNAGSQVTITPKQVASILAANVTVNVFP